MTSTGPDPSTPTPASDGQASGMPRDLAGGLAERAADLLESYARIVSQIAGDDARSAEGGKIGTAAALIEAGSIASGSALRYSQRLTELFAQHQSALLQTVPAHLTGKDLTPEQEKAEVEALRRYLREVGETAMQEARRLDNELSQLGEAVARGIADPVAAEDFKRRAETKP